MHIVPIVLLLSLLLTGCFRGCAKEAPPVPFEGGKVQSSSLSSEPSEEDDEEEEGVTEESSSSAESAVSSQSSSKSSSSSIVSSPTFIVDAFQWAEEYREVFSGIGKLRMIADGTYTLREGEKVHNIFSAYDKLHAELSSLVFPPESPTVKSLAEELDANLQKIILDLSSPPTLSELQTADMRREPLRKKIDALYRALLLEREKQ